MPSVTSRLSLLLFISTACGMAQASSISKGSAATAPLMTDQLMIRLAPAPASPAGVALVTPAVADQLSRAAGRRLHLRRRMDGNTSVLRLEQPVSTREAEQIAQRLSASGLVEAAAPDYRRRRSDGLSIGIGGGGGIGPVIIPATNDPAWPEQWSMTAPGSVVSGETVQGGANLPAAWAISTGLVGTVIAILDTGLVPHADLAGRVLPGYDFISTTFIANDGGGRDNDPTDPGDWLTAGDLAAEPSLCSGEIEADSSWHGTQVAGIAAASGNNSLWMAGVNWGASVLPVRVLGKCGGFDSDIIDGMLWAAGLPVSGAPTNPNPAHVLNLSLGSSSECGPFYSDAISRITERGVIIVAATGNEFARKVNTPARCENVIAVTAHNADGLSAIYANVGNGVAISAPGGDFGTDTDGFSTGSSLFIRTLSNTGTTTADQDSETDISGTSAATPHVAGAIALLRGLLPYATPARLRHLLTSTVRPHPAGSWCTLGTAGSGNQCGSGLLDVGNAVTAAEAALAANHLPVLTSPVRYEQPYAAFNILLTASDANGDAIRFVPVSGSLPTGASLSRSGHLTWLATSVGEHPIRFHLHDDMGRSPEQVVTLVANSTAVASASSGGSLSPALLLALALLAGAWRHRRAVRL
ncbi:MAG: S8 family peptidase [Moraxellaceae bacterium]|nr:S8 family peptidase [Moraxellaceae bacterium]